MKRAFSRVLSLLLIDAALAGADEIVRWTDAKGRVHFSNVAPPPSQAQGGEASAGGTAGEAPPAVAAPAPAAPEVAPAPSEPAAREAAAGKPGPYSNLSAEAFSSVASRQRMRLKSDLAAAKQHVREIDERLATIRAEKSQAVGDAMALLQGMYAPANAASTKEQELVADKKATEDRVDGIRKQYGELRDEAVRRYGGLPDWWLPIE